MALSFLKRFGAGCGIEIRGADLYCIGVKVRSSGVTVLGVRAIEGFESRPPIEWGREYAAFLAECGLSHVAATVGLPRRDVIVRQVQLPPMSEKERTAAILYQLDGLHPFGDDEVVFAHAPLGDAKKTGPAPTAVVIAERERIDRYANLFEEAGVKVAAFTVAAAALYAGLRARSDAPPAPLMIADLDGRTLEVYGESAGRPLLSAEFTLNGLTASRALQLAAADLRLAGDERAKLIAVGEGGEQPVGDAPPAELELAAPEEVFPPPVGAPASFELRRDLTALAVGVESACPSLGWRANLLPEARRKTDSRWLWAPTAALAFLLVLLGVGFWLRPAMQNRAYADALRQKIAELNATAGESEVARAETDQVREKIAVLEKLSRRTRADMDILRELSIVVPSNAWSTLLQIDDAGVRIDGEADTAAPLLGVLTNARTIDEAAFATSLVKIDAGERFQITAKRLVPGDGPAPAPVPAPETTAQAAPPTEAPGGAQ